MDILYNQMAHKFDIQWNKNYLSYVHHVKPMKVHSCSNRVYSEGCVFKNVNPNSFIQNSLLIKISTVCWSDKNMEVVITGELLDAKSSFHADDIESGMKVFSSKCPVADLELYKLT